MRAGWLFLYGVVLAQAGCLAAQASESSAEAQQPTFTAADVANVYAAATSSAPTAGKSHSSSRLSEKPKPLLREDQLPQRNPPIIEWNEPFLGAGNIKPGFTSLTGAIWQPAFWVFGDYRATGGYADDGVSKARAYISTRLDIFGHLQLTPTERVVIGFSPLSAGGNRGTGVLKVDGQRTQFVNGFDPNIKALFFEGDTRQLFPGIDANDRRGLDFGFSIGRQPIFFQEGIMINNSMQALGITKDTIQVPGLTQDIRITGVFGWTDIRRGDNLPDPTAYLLGVFTETQLRKSIITFDFAYVGSDNPRDLAGVQRGGSGVYFGASATQRFGEVNTAFRINTSSALDGRGSAVDNGVLLFTEISRNAPASNNIIYANFFQAFGNYTSAARDAQAGGPLGRVGILFAAPVAGLSGSPISSYTNHAYGGALGYQMFFDANRTQLTLELAAKDDTNGTNQGIVAFGAQYIRAVTSRTSIQFNGFVSAGENRRVGSGLSVESRTRL